MTVIGKYIMAYRVKTLAGKQILATRGKTSW